jgi:hypothetical protein
MDATAFACWIMDWQTALRSSLSKSRLFLSVSFFMSGLSSWAKRSSPPDFRKDADNNKKMIPLTQAIERTLLNARDLRIAKMNDFIGYIPFGFEFLIPCCRRRAISITEFCWKPGAPLGNRIIGRTNVSALPADSPGAKELRNE